MPTRKQPSVSVIIPFHWKYGSPEYVRFVRDLEPFFRQEYPRLEIIIVLDSSEKLDIPKRRNVRILVYPGHTTSPAVKRDYALKFVKGEICAFIDDDAYPAASWVRRAAALFRRDDVIAVGGPGITPKEDGYWEQLSGLVYESYFCSGAAQYRFLPKPARYVDDYPAYNFFVRTMVLRRVGGFGNTFYGGEDTFLCMKLMNEGKILYDGRAVVYHHRRPLFSGLLRQIGNVGLHRGYFAVKYPSTSRRWFYFLPTVLTIGLFSCTAAALIMPKYLLAYAVVVALCILIGAASVIRRAPLIDALLVGAGIIAVHIWYGTYFLKGLFTKKLQH